MYYLLAFSFFFLLFSIITEQKSFGTTLWKPIFTNDMKNNKRISRKQWVENIWMTRDGAIAIKRINMMSNKKSRRWKVDGHLSEFLAARISSGHGSTEKLTKNFELQPLSTKVLPLFRDFAFITRVTYTRTSCRERKFGEMATSCGGNKGRRLVLG